MTINNDWKQDWRIKCRHKKKLLVTGGWYRGNPISNVGADEVSIYECLKCHAIRIDFGIGKGKWSHYTKRPL
jgi:hypothetical protein